MDIKPGDIVLYDSCFYRVRAVKKDMFNDHELILDELKTNESQIVSQFGIDNGLQKVFREVKQNG